MGHIVEKETGARAAFNEFVAKEGIKPFTEYAQAKPNAFFAEAFRLYQTNPAWLKENRYGL